MLPFFNAAFHFHLNYGTHKVPQIMRQILATIYDKRVIEICWRRFSCIASSRWRRRDKLDEFDEMDDDEDEDEDETHDDDVYEDDEEAVHVEDDEQLDDILDNDLTW